MPSAVTFKAMGDWRNQIRVPLRNVYAVSTEVSGRTGEQTCKHAIILMAKSAGVLAKKSKARRRIMRDGGMGGAEYVNVYQQGKPQPSKLYKFRFGDGVRAGDRIEGTWEEAKKIANKGLASRSWLWGLKAINKSTGKRSPIRGVAKMTVLKGGNKVNGYILTNRLDYIDNAMPDRWEDAVSRSVTNTLMAQAAKRLEGKWKSALRRREKATGRAISTMFKVAA